MFMPDGVVAVGTGLAPLGGLFRPTAWSPSGQAPLCSAETSKTAYSGMVLRRPEAVSVSRFSRLLMTSLRQIVQIGKRRDSAMLGRMAGGGWTTSADDLPLQPGAAFGAADLIGGQGDEQHLDGVQKAELESDLSLPIATTGTGQLDVLGKTHFLLVVES